jgi:hypothetical protein
MNKNNYSPCNMYREHTFHLKQRMPEESSYNKTINIHKEEMKD